jgi:orotate phosphoribosyltransferase
MPAQPHGGGINREELAKRIAKVSLLRGEFTLRSGRKRGEDVLTTDGQVLEAAKTLEDAGAKIGRIVVVIDRLEGARANVEGAGYQFESLFTTKDLGIG